MSQENLVILGVFLGFALLEILFTNFFKKPGQTRDDAIVEVVSTAAAGIVIQPIILAAGFSLAAYLAPGAEGMLASWSALAIFALFLIFDDMTQYWWHRATHMVPILYNLHRLHHNATYLSVRIVYRNNLFYYWLMPGLWFSGALIYLGGGWVYTVYLVMKFTIITAAHSDVRWDEPLYKIKWLSPVMWVVERVISTPATHSAHHGKHVSDGVTNYKGNYGNFLFFWDVLFGTALITRRYPTEIGVENCPETSLGEQLFWPIIKADQPLAKETP